LCVINVIYPRPVRDLSEFFPENREYVLQSRFVEAALAKHEIHRWFGRAHFGKFSLC
jgi:hypothetical protein